MRDDQAIKTARRAIENRLEDPKSPFTPVFNAPKRDTLAAVLDGTDPEAIIKKMDSRLLDPELSLQEFMVVMSSKNAASWCLGELGSI